MKKKTTKKRVAKKTVIKRRKTPRNLKSGMKGYVVIWRHTMDDIPIGLFADYDEAYKFARTISQKNGYEIAKKLDINCSTPVCFAICSFVSGAPSYFEFVARKDDF